MICYFKKRRTTQFTIKPNQAHTITPASYKKSLDHETKNEDLNNSLEQQSVFSNDSNTPNIILDEMVEGGKVSDTEASPKELLKSSATSSVVHITDDTDLTSPSLTTVTTYFNSDTSNDTTTTTSSTEGEVLLCYNYNSVY